MSTEARQNPYRAGLLAILLSASILMIWWVLLHRPSQDIGNPPAPPPFVHSGLSKTQFYERDLVPLLDESNKRNHESADKAVERLHQDFDRFRSGIPAFVDDVTSWRTRFGLLRRMTKDRWKNYWKAESVPTSEAVKTYILDKYEAHIMSRDALQKSVEACLSQFKDNMTGSRNTMLAEMKVAMTTEDMKLDFPVPDFNEFQRAYDDYVAGKVQAEGTASVHDAVLTFVASTVGMVAAEKLVAQIVFTLAGEAVAGTAAEAAAGGGATVGGAAVGGGAGTVGGPAGAAIGFGVGLVVGVIIDWWLTDSFKSNLTKELTTYLNNLEHDMTEGTKDNPTSGLRPMLHAAADGFHSIQTQAALDAIGK